MNPLIPILLYAGAYALLFATWAAVVFLKVPGADSLVQYIQITLGALTGHVLTLIDPRSSKDGGAPIDKQGGGALPAFLAALAMGTLLLTGCVTLNPNATPAQQTQVTQMTYTQACAAYGAAFEAALQLRIAGKLSTDQIERVTLLDSQVTPICTGPLPSDAAAATQQVTAAVTTLTILEIAKKETK